MFSMDFKLYFFYFHFFYYDRKYPVKDRQQITENISNNSQGHNFANMKELVLEDVHQINRRLPV